MSPASRFPRPTTSDITKTGIELPAEASEALDKELEFEQVESREARTHRLSTGVLIGIMALVLFILVTKTSGEAHFAFTDALAGKELGTMSVSGFPVVLVSAIACLLAAGAFFMGRSRHTLTVTAGVVAGIAIIVGFLSWAAAGRGLPFQVAGQLQGTLSVATPLVLGALCGVMCERAGVVNVAIEGEMLTAAFAAALVGSITKSIFAAIVVGIVASVLTAALLAVFTIKYFVDQVVMGRGRQPFCIWSNGLLLHPVAFSERRGIQHGTDHGSSRDPGAVEDSVLWPDFLRPDCVGVYRVPLYSAGVVPAVAHYVGAARPVCWRASRGR